MDTTNAVWTGDKWREHLIRLKHLQGVPDEILTNLEKQERFILQTNLHPVPCPLCETPVGSRENNIECPKCGISLVRIVPLVRLGEPGWFWTFTQDARKYLLALWRTNRASGPRPNIGSK